MEYKWEAVKEDAEVGFQIESGPLIGWGASDIKGASIWKPVEGIIKTNEEKC